MNTLRGALHDENTEIARLVRMRLETNPDILKQYTSEQKRAVAEWRLFWGEKQAKRLKHMPEQQRQKMEQKAEAFADALFASLRGK